MTCLPNTLRTIGHSSSMATIAVVLGLLLIESSAYAQRNKKPPKDDPPPEPTPEVLYRHETMSMPTLALTTWNQAQSNGLAVGSFSDSTYELREPFLYDHDGVFNGGIAPRTDTNYNAFHQLKDLFESELPAGWTMLTAIGVNRYGDIVGAIQDAQSDYRGFIIDTSATAFSDPAAPPSSNSADWTMRLLPDLGSTSSWGYQINDQGVVLGRLDNLDDYYLYDAFDPAASPVTLGIDVGNGFPQLNNQNQVAGVLTDYRAFILDLNDVGDAADDQLWVSPDDPNTQFRNVTDFNDSGFFSGRADVRINGKGPIREYAYSYSMSGVLDIVIPEWDQQDASGAFINEDNDVLSLAPPYIRDFDILVHAGIEPDFNEQQALVQDLLDPNDPLTSYWFDYEVTILGMGERDPETGYPRIFAEFYDDDGLIDPFGVVLVPFRTGGVAAAAIPEPATVILLTASLIVAILVARRPRQLATFCVAASLASTTAMAQTYTLTHTFDDPTRQGGFGRSIALEGNHVLIGSADPFATEAYLFDATTGALLQTFHDPTPPTLGDGDREYFGWSAAIDGNYVLIGDYLDDTDGEGWGQAHLFDATTGDLLQTFSDPTPQVAINGFGSAVAIDGNRVLIGGDHNSDGIFDTVDLEQVHLFDVDGNLLRTFNNLPVDEGDPSDTAADDGFGTWSGSVVLQGNYALIGALNDDTLGVNVGQAYLLDATTGSLLQTFNDPTPHDFDQFGMSVALDGEHVLIGERTGEEAHLFDISGNLLHTFDDPTPTTEDHFGTMVAIDGDSVLISDPFSDAHGKNSGQAHLFDLSGNLRWTFDNPTPAGEDWFGWPVAFDGDRVLLGAVSDDTIGENVGQAYLFELQAVPEPATCTLVGWEFAVLLLASRRRLCTLCSSLS